jgi:transcriptional regulator GlxA family with amidase domain
MGSVESLRHHFRRRVGTTPARYRARFARRAPPARAALRAQ